MNFPFLTVILLAPIIAAIISIFIPKEEVKTIKVISAVGMFVSVALTIYLYFTYSLADGGIQFKEYIPWTKDLGVAFYLGADGIGLPMLLLTNLIGFSAVYASWNVDKRPKEFFILLLILITGVMGTFIAQDLFIFFLFYEVVVIPIYIMVIIWGSTKRVSKEYAGMKLTIYLLIGSAFLLAGMVYMYTKAVPLNGGTDKIFEIAQLAQLNFTPSDQKLIFGFMAFGFATLLSMFPFHSWSPDGYAGAPTAVSMIHAGVLKKIGGYGLIKVGIFIFPLGARFWAPYIAVLAVGNVVYAALIALAQKDLKYVVGYSSVSHMGYVLIGIAALNQTGLSGAVGNMFAHGVMAALFFAMIGYVYEKTHTRYIPDLGGLAHQIPKVAVGFMLAAMASVGLPGLVNFVPEFTTFIGAYQVYPVLTVVAITGVVLGAVYVLRAMANVLFGPRKEAYDWLPDAKGPEMVPIIVLGVFLVVFGMFPSLLMKMINVGVQDIVAHVETATKAAMMGGKF